MHNKQSAKGRCFRVMKCLLVALILLVTLPFWGIVVLVFGMIVVPVFGMLVVLYLLYLVWSVTLHLLAWTLWIPKGINTVYVYSNSPDWQEHIEQNVLPRLAGTAVALNWSERKKWKRTLATLAFRHFGGYREFCPLALVFSPFRRVKIFRFHQPFKDYKHGKCRPLRTMESEFFLTVHR